MQENVGLQLNNFKKEYFSLVNDTIYFRQCKKKYYQLHARNNRYWIYPE